MREALKVAPGDRNAMHNLVLVLLSQKKFDEAMAVANQTLQAFPSSGEALCLAGTIHLEKKSFEAASRFIDQSLAINPDYAEAVVASGRYYFDTQQPQRAIDMLKRAIDLEPRHADAYNLLGCALRETGAFDEAISAFEKSIELAPRNTSAIANLAETKTFRSPDDRHLAVLEGMVAAPDILSDDEAMQVHFALGKAHDELNQFDRAFAHMSAACRIKRLGANYAEGDTLELFERIRAEFTRDIVAKFKGAGDPSQLPIFVFGMPRSGTTLIEQIVASHPMVKGAGEVRDVHDALVDLRPRVQGQRPYPEMLNDASAGDLAFFGQSVVRRLARRWPQSLRITDKMPSNFFFLGLLRLALPNARFIHARRNPVDTCLSCYSKQFVGEINYTYDLGELGRYYKAYDALMQHWREVLPSGSFLDVQYEDVVGDLEGQAKRILDHCGLAWDPAVLEFHKTERAIKTASAVQIRRPIYKSSIERWKNYETHLEPLLAALGELAK